MTSHPIIDAELARMDRELTDAVERDGEQYLVTDAPKDMRRLLAEVDRLRAENTAQAERIAATLELHKPSGMSEWGHRTCTECDTPGYYQDWPCPTVRALGLDEEGIPS